MNHATSYQHCCPRDPGPEPNEADYTAAEERVAGELDDNEIWDALCDAPEFADLFTAFARHLFMSNPVARERVLRRYDGKVEDAAQEIMREEIERSRQEARANAWEDAA